MCDPNEQARLEILPHAPHDVMYDLDWDDWEDTTPPDTEEED